MLGSLRDLLPIILVIAAFQLLVFWQPLENLPQVLGGLGLVVLGLTLFVFGLDIGLFPVGEQLAHAFARRGSLPWLVVFAFALGFGTTVAEPALIAVTAEAGRLSGGGEVWQTALQLTVAAAVGVALMLGVMRILLGWSLPWLIVGGYVIVMALTPLAPAAIVGVAFDTGGVELLSRVVFRDPESGGVLQDSVGEDSSFENKNDLVMRAQSPPASAG